MSAGHIPGNGIAIDSETKRLERIADSLSAIADRLRGMRIPTWEGPAADAFDAWRTARVRSVARASDLHQATARQLATYQETRLRAEQLISGVMAEWQGRTMPPYVVQQLADLRGQVDKDARTAAATMTEAADSLADLISPDGDPVGTESNGGVAAERGPESAATAHAEEQPDHHDQRSAPPPAPIVSPSEMQKALDPQSIATQPALYREVLGTVLNQLRTGNYTVMKNL